MIVAWTRVRLGSGQRGQSGRFIEGLVYQAEESALTCPEAPTLALHLYQSSMATVMLHIANCLKMQCFIHQVLFLILSVGQLARSCPGLRPVYLPSELGRDSSLLCVSLSIFWSQQASQGIFSWQQQMPRA